MVKDLGCVHGAQTHIGKPFVRNDDEFVRLSVDMPEKQLWEGHELIVIDFSPCRVQCFPASSADHLELLLTDSTHVEDGTNSSARQWLRAPVCSLRLGSRGHIHLSTQVSVLVATASIQGCAPSALVGVAYCPDHAPTPPPPPLPPSPPPPPRPPLGPQPPPFARDPLRFWLDEGFDVGWGQCSLGLRLSAEVKKNLITVHVRHWLPGTTIIVNHGDRCQLWLAPQSEQDDIGLHGVSGAGSGFDSNDAVYAETADEYRESQSLHAVRFMRQSSGTASLDRGSLLAFELFSKTHQGISSFTYRVQTPSEVVERLTALHVPLPEATLAVQRREFCSLDDLHTSFRASPPPPPPPGTHHRTPAPVDAGDTVLDARPALRLACPGHMPLPPPLPPPPRPPPRPPGAPPPPPARPSPLPRPRPPPIPSQPPPPPPPHPPPSPPPSPIQPISAWQRISSRTGASVSADIHVIEHVTEEGMELLVHASFIALSLACVLACLSAVTRLYRRKLITGCLAVRSRYVPAASDEPTIHRTRQLSGGRRLSGGETPSTRFGSTRSARLLQRQQQHAWQQQAPAGAVHRASRPHQLNLSPLTLGRVGRGGGGRRPKGRVRRKESRARAHHGDYDSEEDYL